LAALLLHQPEIDQKCQTRYVQWSRKALDHFGSETQKLQTQFRIVLLAENNRWHRGMPIPGFLQKTKGLLSLTCGIAQVNQKKMNFRRAIVQQRSVGQFQMSEMATFDRAYYSTNGFGKCSRGSNKKNILINIAFCHHLVHVRIFWLLPGKHYALNFSTELPDRTTESLPSDRQIRILTNE
jgi:hypothetical protein